MGISLKRWLQVEKVKSLLRREMHDEKRNIIPVVPILHNKGKAILEFSGWLLVLEVTGWYWEKI